MVYERSWDLMGSKEETKGSTKMRTMGERENNNSE